MSFDIMLLNETTDDSELANTGQYGEIVLDDERERFVSLIGFWSPRDYELQWRNGIRRLVREGQNSCLITSLHDPTEVDVINWWLLYPDGDVVHIQEALLLLAEHKIKFSTSDPYASIPPRMTVDEDGNQISEWTLRMSDFESFLTRQ